MFDASATQANLNHVANAGLTVDGIAGPATFAALLARAGLNGSIPLGHDLGVALVAHLDAYDINTSLRVRHFLAQAACETFAFTVLKERGDAAYFQRYEGRRDLGNTQPGDGARFCGRGLLDTTGRYNYALLAGLTGLDCINHPELLEVPDNAVLAACIYWQHRNVNALADANDINGVTRAVNGGLNGLADRMTFFDRLGVLQ
jgi:putative chitinase